MTDLLSALGVLVGGTVAATGSYQRARQPMRRRVRRRPEEGQVVDTDMLPAVGCVHILDPCVTGRTTLSIPILADLTVEHGIPTVR